MSILKEKLSTILFGPPRDPLSPETKKHVALMAFFAWIGLGADGLSSSAYGPEEAFKALGSHTHLSLYLALATALTVFLISTAYNQVIELFPSGGGGYKVATILLGPHIGLVSGAALIVDYVLTIAISIASGVDAVFSTLPVSWQPHKLLIELILSVFLVYLNLRGVKESIKILTPIFLAFVITHVLIIFYGVGIRATEIPTVIHDTLTETSSMGHSLGWIFVAALFLKAYSLGGGTYTGIEAVSNNINALQEPRVHTGKLTMFYMASSLAFTASGIILLYLLWHATPANDGSTLNAVAFHSVIGSLGLSTSLSQILVITLLVTEGALLFVAANTGLLGGPAVLANMAIDHWVPTQFSSLSTRLVTKHGITIMGLAAILLLIWSKGVVDLLAVLYSINVFLTFTLSLVGLCVHWWRNREKPSWLRHLSLSLFGTLVTGSILIVTIYEKFFEGGWLTILLTSSVIAFCLFIHRHYEQTANQIALADATLAPQEVKPVDNPPALNPEKQTAVFLISRSRGIGMHTLLWVLRLFPNTFHNYIFLSVGAVDTKSFEGESSIEGLRTLVHHDCDYYTNFCHANGLAAQSYESYGTDRVHELTQLALSVQATYPNCVFFASKLIFTQDNWFTRFLHNQTALTMQRILHLQGVFMIVLPMKIGDANPSGIH